MPRPFRSAFQDGFHHVMARGDNRELIFIHQEDYSAYLRFLADAAERFDCEVHAYCLMTNHLHLLLRGTGLIISQIMERVQGRYARLFNRKHRRIGHVFQGRYVSRVVLNNAYLFEVGRYIHMNPVEAGLAGRPEDYHWSSFRHFLRGGDQGDWIITGTLLAPYSGAKAFADFYDFTVARQAVHGDERGWPKFAEWYVKQSPDANRSPEPLLHAGGVHDAADIIDLVAQNYGCSADALRSGWKSRSLAKPRAAAMWILRENTMLTLGDIARELKYRSIHGVGNTLKRVRDRSERDPVFQACLENLSSRVRALKVKDVK